MEPRPPAEPAARSRQHRALAATLGGALGGAALAWFAAQHIESPADAAARTAPPKPSPILVPIEQRVLASTIVTRGTARFGLPQKIALAPSALKPSPGLVASLPQRNAAFDEGQVLMTVSGRPVFVLRGALPAYRDLQPGVAGEDVRQLQHALKRLGFDPGADDGHYDARTAAAVRRWYVAKQWEPFGPTREQLVALSAAERDWAEAYKASETARSAAGAAALAVDAAQAAADHGLRAAEAELAAKRAEAARWQAGGGATESMLDAERAKAAHADSAAAAEVATQTAERALVVLDPRQPESARAAADAKLQLAQAAARRTHVEGELALQAAQRDAQLAAGQIALAEASLRAARLDGQKAVQAALDAQRLAELESRLGAQRSARLASELAALQARIGVQVPADEIAFIPALPVRVEEVAVQVGASASGALLSVTDNQLAVDAALALDAAARVKPGMPVAIDEQDLGIQARGVIAEVAGTPGTRGADGYHVHVEVRVTESQARIEGHSLRLTIPVQSTGGAVLAVPLSALSLAADGRSHVQVPADGNGNTLRPVVVRPGLAADGYVEITPLDGTLAAGQLVAVGNRRPEKETP